MCSIVREREGTSGMSWTDEGWWSRGGMLETEVMEGATVWVNGKVQSSVV